jgi:anti-sigma factor RsiW
MNEHDPVTVFDLDAYVDNQLDTECRIRVEKHLADNPETASKVMADLAMRGALKLALQDGSEQPSHQMKETAHRLSFALGRKRLWSNLQRIAAVGILVTTGWIASAIIGPFAATDVVASVHPPAFVEQAIKAHQTTLVRATMPSQPEVKHYDPDDIRSATAITMPELPDDWEVVDVQIFPSDYGPSVEMSIQTSDGTRMSLFAVRPGTFAVERVTDVNLSNSEAAYWQVGEIAYALIASAPNTGLADEAEQLTKSYF